MKVFTAPPQPNVTLDDVKAASVAFARKHGYVEEASRGELSGVVVSSAKARVSFPSSGTKKASHQRVKDAA